MYLYMFIISFSLKFSILYFKMLTQGLSNFYRTFMVIFTIINLKPSAILLITIDKLYGREGYTVCERHRVSEMME